jgi:hypothetical protein
MIAPLLALAAAAEDADPLEPRLPHLSFLLSSSPDYLQLIASFTLAS